MTKCKQIYPKPGSISKPGYQCDVNEKNHEGNHSEKIKDGNISLTLEWS